MTAPGPEMLAERLGCHAAEILRWNRQINLVSRVDTRRRIDQLQRQCRDAWDLVRGVLGDDPAFSRAISVDIGSGAGLPGLVWAALRRAEGHVAEVVLVEPRDKRAWFLRRTAQQMGLVGVRVENGRWGEVPIRRSPSAGDTSDTGKAPGASPGAARDAGDRDADDHVLVSLKALHLTDQEVLDGFLARGEDAATWSRVSIVRFLDPREHTQERLEEEFAAAVDAAHLPWRRGGAEVLGARGARLLVTRYHA